MSDLALYIHFPFCERKCPYCDFASFGTGQARIPHEAYAKSVVTELEARLDAMAERGRATSLYVGGGTPSLWEPAYLRQVLASCARRTGLRLGEDEVSIECNPSSFSAEKAQQYVDMGINRVSIGLQSTKDRWLKALGRAHDARQGLRAVEIALSAGFASVSVDLMHGLPDEDERDAAEQAGELAAMGVDHVSAYLLTFHPTTVFGRRVGTGAMALPDEDVVAASYEAVAARLEGAGLLQYEVSNFARPGHQCRHHLMVWRGAFYMGLGTGAVGTVRLGSGTVVRWRNRPSAAWPKVVEQAGRRWWEMGEQVDELEYPTPSELMTERVMLGLRLREGIDVAAEERRLGVRWWTPGRRRVVDDLQRRGRLVQQQGRIRIPLQALIWENDTILRLI